MSKNFSYEEMKEKSYSLQEGLLKHLRFKTLDGGTFNPDHLIGTSRVGQIDISRLWTLINDIPEYSEEFIESKEKALEAVNDIGSFFTALESTMKGLRNPPMVCKPPNYKYFEGVYKEGECAAEPELGYTEDKDGNKI